MASVDRLVVNQDDQIRCDGIFLPYDSKPKQLQYVLMLPSTNNTTRIYCSSNFVS